MVEAFFAGRLATHIGGWRALSIGCASITIGALVLATVRLVEQYVFPVLPGFALIGLGLGFAFTAFTIMATEHVPENDQGSASGLLNTAQQLGFAIGIATIVTTAQAANEPLTGYSIGYIIDAAIVVIGLTAALLTARRSFARWPASLPRNAQRVTQCLDCKLWVIW